MTKTPSPATPTISRNEILREDSSIWVSKVNSVVSDKAAIRWWRSNIGKFLSIFLMELRERDNVGVIRAAKPVCRRTTERGKVINPEYSIFRDQPTPGASPLRINTLLSTVLSIYFVIEKLTEQRAI